jgi:two-component system, OmpR family, response regulator ChvI
MASRAGHFFTYRAIYDRLRHEGFVAGEGPHGYWANVRSAIKRLRNKFRTFDPAFNEIENYTGFGYGWRKPD